MEDVRKETITWRDKEYLSITDITKILYISRPVAKRIVVQLPYVKAGTLYRVPTAAFQKWLKDEERRNA